MTSHPVRGLVILVVAAVACLGGSCFSDYASDCSRNVDLACFWEGGSGGTGGAAPACGNAVLDTGEACDDGNTVDCDGCRGDCSVAETGCGDGLLCGAEDCDEGAANLDTGACTTACKNAACGDGFRQAGEECDDGNTAADDGCVDCKIECGVGNLPVGGKPDINAALYRDDKTFHCYVRVDNPRKSWAAARVACQAWGGELAGLSTFDEAGVVISALPPKSGVWTGGNDLMSPDVFAWSNGEPWQDDLPWASGEPNDDGAGPNAEACVELDADKRLYDRDCAALDGYLCERVLEPPAP